MVVGDFNIVAEPTDKLGGNRIDINDVQDFNNIIHNAGLMDGGYSGSKYT